MSRKTDSRPANRLVHVATSDLAIKYLLRNQLRSFRVLGYDVFALTAPGDNRAELEREPFRYDCLPVARRINPAADVRSYIRMTDYFARGGFDAVHTHTNKAGVLGCWAARRAGVPRILTTVHGFYFHDRMNAAVRAAFIRLYRRTFRFVDRVFMQSAEDVRTAAEYGIAPSDRVVHLGNGIDLERFDPRRPGLDGKAAKLRVAAGIPGHATLLGIVARVNHEKGYSELLDVARAIVTRDPSVHVVAVGDGPARHYYEELSRRLGIAANVHFVGFSEDIPGWLAAMDVFVLPSHREGFPRTLCEAFAMGTPSVATRIRGCRELIDDGDTGLLVEPNDRASLRRALERLLGDVALRRRLAGNARRVALASLDERNIVHRIDGVYRELGLRPVTIAHPGPTAPFPSISQPEGAEAI